MAGLLQCTDQIHQLSEHILRTADRIIHPGGLDFVHGDLESRPPYLKYTQKPDFWNRIGTGTVNTLHELEYIWTIVDRMLKLYKRSRHGTGFDAIKKTVR